eukprot:GILI01043704.1.p1 GENE.GILI01043704.1~~GILI01043704.1.p1  ORF type:complete len:109 (+),score=25.63 GILI01043704.1:65-391(+)
MSSAKATAAPQPPIQSTPILRLARKWRNFSFTKWVGYHPYTSYFALVFGFILWGNVLQQRALRGYYPDYEAIISSGAAGGLASAKLQEYADVQRYNNMVATMRSDLKK